MMPKVSIIVPVYNVEKYLRRCLDSLVMQTLSEIEIIVVNDGTKDNSQVIIDEFVQKYPNKVHSYIKENGGLGDARNFGLQFASAQYIGFIDSDDYVEHNMYELMYLKALQECADIVLCDIEYVWENSNQKLQVNGLKLIEGTDIQKSAFLSPLFAWNKLYHRDLFMNSSIRYPMNLWYEDIPVTLPLFALANKIAYVNESMVHYVQRNSSIMATKNSLKMRDIFEILSKVYDFFEKNDLLIKFKDEIEYVYIEQLMLYGSFRFYRNKSGLNLISESIQIMKDFFPNWRKNQYIKVLHSKYQFYLSLLNRFTAPLFMLLIFIKDMKIRNEDI